MDRLASQKGCSDCPFAAGGFCCLCHSLSHGPGHVSVEDAWQDMSPMRFVDAPGDRMSRSHLHFVGDPGGTRIQRPPEYARECEHIVDLVWKIAAAVPTTAAPAAVAASGQISGTGLAIAKTMGSLFIDRIIAWVMIPGLETPITASAPSIASASEPSAGMVGHLA